MNGPGWRYKLDDALRRGCPVTLSLADCRDVLDIVDAGGDPAEQALAALPARPAAAPAVPGPPRKRLGAPGAPCLDVTLDKPERYLEALDRLTNAGGLSMLSYAEAKASGRRAWWSQRIAEAARRYILSETLDACTTAHAEMVTLIEAERDEADARPENGDSK